MLVTLGIPFRSPLGTGRPREDYVEAFRRVAPPSWKFVVPRNMDEEELSRLIVDADVVLGGNVSRKAIENARKLRLIQALGSGVDSIDLEAARKRGVTVCNTKGINAVSVAEHIFALMLCLAKNLRIEDQTIRAGNWEAVPSLRLKGTTLGIVGLGSIGIEVAKRAQAFGMGVIATKKNPSTVPGDLQLQLLGGPGDLDHLLSNSDVVVLCTPLTETTRGMMGASQFRKMKRGALLVNTARGGLVDERAMVEALRDGTLGAAGLDVFEKEPVPPTSELLSLENVVLTPHVAGGFPSADSEDFKSRTTFCIGNIQRFLAGERPQKLVTEFFKDSSVSAPKRMRQRPA